MLQQFLSADLSYEQLEQNPVPEFEQSVIESQKRKGLDIVSRFEGFDHLIVLSPTRY